ncbi:MAG: VOC family protein, partial [Clostridia bacterium]
MKYNQALLVVKDIDKSVKFYCDVLEQKVVNDFGANKTLTGGFSLQTLNTWKEFIQKEESGILFCNNACELYFEEDNMDAFLQKLKSFSSIEFVHNVKEHAWGQRVVRFYDPDRHIIEVGENINSVIMRFISSGLTIEKTA